MDEKIKKLAAQAADISKEVVLPAGEWLVFDPEPWGQNLKDRLPKDPFNLHPIFLSFEGRGLPASFSIYADSIDVKGLVIDDNLLEIETKSGHFLLLPEKIGTMSTGALEYLKEHPDT